MNTRFFAIAAAAAIATAAVVPSSAGAATHMTRHYRHALTGAYGYAASAFPGAALNGTYGYAPTNGYRSYSPAPPITVYGAEQYRRRAPNADLNPDFQLGGNRS
jgi:hypothetical protein